MKCFYRWLIFLLFPLLVTSCSQRYAHLTKVKVKETHEAKAPRQNSPAQPESALEVTLPDQESAPQSSAQVPQTVPEKAGPVSKSLKKVSLRTKAAEKAVRNLVPTVKNRAPLQKLSPNDKDAPGKTQWAGALFLGLLFILASALLVIAGLGAGLGYILGTIGFVLIIISLVLLVLGGA